MAPHIVSWGATAPAASPASSSSPSVVSFDSLSDVQPPKGPEAHGGTETGTNSANSSTGEINATLTPVSIYPGVDDSFQRHDTYFFKDGNITFLVDGTLYCVHRFFFSRDSVYFSTRLAQLGTRDHEALTTIVSLGDVEREDFEALLSVIYPKDFEEHNLSYQQWKSVLHLSTRWSFASIRKLALKSINPPTPHDRLVLARTYAVDQWVQPALTALCERAEPLSLTEACQMRIEDVVLVAAVREDVRSRVLRIDGTKVTRVVEAALAEKHSRNEGASTCRASPEGGAAKRGTGSATAASPVGAKRGDGNPNKYFTQWEGKGVTKSAEANATQGVGNAAGPAQAAPKPEGEPVLNLKPSGSLFGAFAAPAGVESAFSSTTAKTTISKGKLPVGTQESTSTHEVLAQSTFLFGIGKGSAPSPSLFGTPPLRQALRPVETSSPSAEPATKKAKVPNVNLADNKASVK
ncbi:hypothetical protein BJY52DRAFT_672827 [Lactarius psammicola]|nr:hypothetical protein BJY52DRAFT_672827 [Lactarius psammicola]